MGITFVVRAAQIRMRCHVYIHTPEQTQAYAHSHLLITPNGLKENAVCAALQPAPVAAGVRKCPHTSFEMATWEQKTAPKPSPHRKKSSWHPKPTAQDSAATC